MRSERGVYDPYRFWKSGFTFEVVLFSGFTLATAALGFLTWWIFR